MVTCGLIIVDIDSLQLEIRVTMVGASWVYAMLIRDNLPELEYKNCISDNKVK